MNIPDVPGFAIQHLCEFIVYQGFCTKTNQVVEVHAEIVGYTDPSRRPSGQPKMPASLLIAPPPWADHADPAKAGSQCTFLANPTRYLGLTPSSIDSLLSDTSGFQVGTKWYCIDSLYDKTIVTIKSIKDSQRVNVEYCSSLNFVCHYAYLYPVQPANGQTIYGAGSNTPVAPAVTSTSQSFPVTVTLTQPVTNISYHGFLEIGPPAPGINQALFPHKCPHCGSPAYHGFNTVECSNPSCFCYKA